MSCEIVLQCLEWPLRGGRFNLMIVIIKYSSIIDTTAVDRSVKGDWNFGQSDLWKVTKRNDQIILDGTSKYIVYTCMVCNIKYRNLVCMFKCLNIHIIYFVNHCLQILILGVEVVEWLTHWTSNLLKDR